MENNYTEYAIIDAKIAELTAKKEGLRVKILEEMVANGEDKVTTGVGSFSVSKLKSWTYPEKVLELGEKFKAAKAKSESTGDDSYVEKSSLRFTSIKL